MDIPAGAEIELGGELGVRIGNLQYTGFDLSDKSGDNTLSFHLSNGQRSAWNALQTAAGDPLGMLVGRPLLDSLADSLSGLAAEAAGLATPDALALIAARMRASGGTLLGGGLVPAPGLQGIDPSLVQPFADTLDLLIEHFYYERPGEFGLRNLELRGEATGSATSQYRYLTAGGSEVYAEVTRGARLFTEDALGLSVTYPQGAAPGGSVFDARYHRRSASASAYVSSFTVGRDRWALAVSEIDHHLRFSLDATRLHASLEPDLARTRQAERSRDYDSSQVESRIWTLRRSRVRGWNLEMGLGLGSLRARRLESESSASGARALSPAGTEGGLSLPGAPGGESHTASGSGDLLAALGAEATDLSLPGSFPEPPALPGVMLPALDSRIDAAEEESLASRSRTRLGAGVLLGARRIEGAFEAGVRAVYFGSLRQQATAAAGRALPLGRLGLVGDLQADFLRQPGTEWDPQGENFRLRALSSAALTPTAALIWSLEPGAIAGLHAWQSPFEWVARRRDPRRLGRALFAGASGRGADEIFAGLSFGGGSYLSASLRLGEGSYRHVTLSGRARDLHMEVGLGGGRRSGESAEDGRRQASLSYLQFVYNRDGERFLSLTFDPENRGLDVAMVADAASLAGSMGRAWTRLRRLLGL